MSATGRLGSRLLTVGACLALLVLGLLAISQSAALGAASTTIPVGSAPLQVAVDPSLGVAYVSNFSSGTVSVIDEGSNTVTDTITVGRGPKGLAVDTADHTLYVANETSNTVSVVDGLTDTVTSTVGVPSGSQPTGVAVDTTTQTVYVTDFGLGEVSVIDTADTPPAVIGAVTVDMHPSGIAVDDLTDVVYVANEGSGNVSVVNGTTCEAGNISGCATTPPTDTVGSTPTDVDLIPEADEIYVADSGASTISVIEGSTNAVTAIEPGGEPEDLRVDPSSGTVYATLATGNVAVINGSSGAVAAILPVGSGARGVGVDSATGAVFVANLITDSVSVFHPASHAVSGTIGLGASSPDGVAFDAAHATVYVVDNGTVSVVSADTGFLVDAFSPPGGGTMVGAAVDQASSTLYVSDFSEDVVWVVSTAGCNAMNTTGCSASPSGVRVGAGPWGVSVDPATDTVYVADQGSDTLSVIDGATCNAADSSGCGSTPPTVNVGNAPEGVAVNTATDEIYVANSNSGNLSVITGATCNASVTSGCAATPPTVGVGTTPAAAAVDPSTGTVYVANQGSDTMSVIAGASNTVTGTVNVGSGPDGVAADPSTATVYVANSIDNTVSAIDSTTDALVDTVAVGSQPAGLAVDASTGSVFVSNSADGTVSLMGDRDVAGVPAVQSSSAGDGSVTLTWSAPAGDGGSAITSYVVAAAPAGGGQAMVLAVPSTQLGATVTGLSDGTTYHVTVTADNGIGAGAPSAVLSLTPAGLPGVPGFVSATAGDHSATVSFVVPPSNGSAISSYTITPYLGSLAQASTLVTCPCASSPISQQVTGLTNGDTYVFFVSASNGVGTSASSNPSPPTTPQTVASTTTVKPSTASVIYGDEEVEQFTVTVAPDSPATPTGKVTLKSGTTTVCTVTLSAGSGTCRPAAGSLPAGTAMVVGEYGGDGNFAASASAPVLLNVAKASSASVLTLSASTVTFGDEEVEHFSVVVSPQFTGTPTGKVTVRSGSTTVCTATLSAGKGGCSPAANALAVGVHTIVAAYPGNVDFSASTSSGKALTVKS